MIGTAQAPSPFDPLADMPPDEARFVIRGRDTAGPDAITEWARITRKNAYAKLGDNPSEDAQKAFDAKLRQCAEAEEMALQWREDQRRAEATEGEGGSHQDVERTEEQLEELSGAKRHEAAIQHLREAAYHLSEARTAFGAIGFTSKIDLTILGASQRTINNVADRQKAAG